MEESDHCPRGNHKNNLQLVKKDDAFLVENSTFSRSYLNSLLTSNDPKDKIMLNLIVTRIVKNDHKDSFEYLLNHGYKIDILNDQNQTAIHLLVYNNSENILKYSQDFLLSKCVKNTSHIDINGLSYLHFACMIGKKKAVKKFLDVHPDVNGRWYHDSQDDRDGFTPLHFAVYNHKTEIVKFLLYQGADVNSTDSSGRTPFHVACCSSKIFSKPQEDDVTSHPDWNSEMKVIKLLEAHGANLNSRDKIGNTPLLSVFKNDKYRREIKFIDEILVEDNFKNVKSLQKRQKEILDYLIERGVDITVVNHNGENILHRIIGDLKPSRFPISYDYISFDDEFHAKLIDMLLALGCGINVNEKNNRGETPLLCAISFLSVDIVKALLEHNAGVNDLEFNYRDENFFNFPLILPNLKATRNLFSIIQLLKDKGFELSPRNNLAILRFLIHEVQDCECYDTINCHITENNLSHTIYFGSSEHIEYAKNTVKSNSKGSKYEEQFDMVIRHDVWQYLKLCKIANMPYSKDDYRDAKKNNCCSQEQFFEIAKVEVGCMKYIVLEDNVTLYDLLIMDLEKIHDYVKNAKRIDKILQRFLCYRGFIKLEKGIFEVFSSLKGLIKLDNVCIDNNVFRLHYKATFLILAGFSLLVTAKQYIGDPIDCIVDEIPLTVMDTYCWISSTFTIPYRNGIVGRDLVQPGVGNYVPGEGVKYHKYYQWVCFCLFFQAILFYIPRYLWKTWEGGRIKMLVLDLQCPVLNEKEDEEENEKEDCKPDRRKLLLDYFIANMHSQNIYAFRFFFCELLNFINVLSQIYFMDFFLDGEFSSYGSDVVKFMEMEPEERSDPMTRVFPKVTKCTFHKYGSTGTVENYDGLCVLPLNIVNEKIYIFLWFWFIILSVLSGLNLVYRAIVMSWPKLRMILLRARSRLSSQRQIKVISKRCQIGDWFVLYQLGVNMDPLVYRELIADLAKTFEGKMIV